MPTFRAARASQDDVMNRLREPGQLLGIEREKAEVKEAKKNTHEKVSNYGKYVREMYWPKVSEKNQSEMVSLRAKIDNQNTAKR